MKIEVSIGKIVDKLSILQIKKEKIKDPNKLLNIESEFLYLHEVVFSELNIKFDDYTMLYDINNKLWVIEDKLRELEKDTDFGSDFIELARAVYYTNDERAKIKRNINIEYGSGFVEEKSYSDYTNKTNSVEVIFNELINTPSDINEHLLTLKEYAEKCSHITEMGVRIPTSTWAFLAGNPEVLISYDIIRDDNIKNVEQQSKLSNTSFKFIESDVLKIKIDPTDLLFIDTLHTYNQLSKELNLHASNVGKYIILHDTVTYGFVDEQMYDHVSDVVKNNDTDKKGLRLAISEFINKYDNEWDIEREYLNNNGLTILRRIH